VGEVGKEEEGHLRVAGVGCVEGGDSDEKTEDDIGPKDGTSNEKGGAMGWSPVEWDERVFGEALVEADHGEQTLEKGSQQGTDDSEDKDRQQQSEQAREKISQCDESSVCGLAQGEFDLLPHGRISLQICALMTIMD
jgi:hypothetical protein